MRETLLNHVTSPEKIEAIVDMLRSFFTYREAIYISVPITTGLRFLRWYRDRGKDLDPRSPEYQNEYYWSVIRPNLEEARNWITNFRRGCRDSLGSHVVDPTFFELPEWNQDERRFFWGKVIERYANTVIFLKGWQYSKGCCFEFLTANRCGIRTFDEDRSLINRKKGIQLIRKAIFENKEYSIWAEYFRMIIEELHSESKFPSGSQATETSDLHGMHVDINRMGRMLLKDMILNEVARSRRNVAQFVSFEPDSKLTQRFSHIRGFEPNFRFLSSEMAIAKLIANSSDQTVNVRRFRPARGKGEPFWYGLRSVDEVMAVLQKNASEGMYSIVNETIDVKDNGVSGVAIDRIVEFSPFDTPKCVDKPGVCALPRDIALRILEEVYGFAPALNFDSRMRVEFSIHPRRRGLFHEHTIIWELEDIGEIDLDINIIWPNNFSRFLGDKAYGLLIADALGLPVPRTTVITRKVSPFAFGRETTTHETWMRTCPEVRVPGKYPTRYGWYDPFELMAVEDRRAEEDPKSIRIASVLAQQAVDSVYSGSLLPLESGEPFIEGLRGRGDDFMIGRAAPETLPVEVTKAVENLYIQARESLGPIGMEWVYDGKMAWVVQLQKGCTAALGGTIYPGQPKFFRRFDVSEGLEALRNLIATVQGKEEGIILTGDIGVTSHFGDILRRAQIPSRIERLRQF